jgi:hypothetical protein
MPEFIPAMVPAIAQTGTELSEFLNGYFACAEWLLDEEEAPKLRDTTQWSALARREAMRDARAFLAVAGTALRAVSDSYAMARAGHDFWLTRNGHGAGFWDREELEIPGPDGRDQLGEWLSTAARRFGEIDVYVQCNRLHFT